MKTKIVSFVRVSEHSMVASVRIARFVSNMIGATLHWPASSGGQKIWNEPIDDEPLDRLVIVGGAYAFAGNDVLAALGRAIMSAGQIIWIQNDYTVIPPKVTGKAESPFRKVFRERHESKREPVHYWTTVKNMSVPSKGRVDDGYVFGEHSRYINWNCLTMAPVLEPKPWDARELGDMLVYYGSYRDGSGAMTREPYFERYFRNPQVRTIISSPDKKFRENFVHLKTVHVERMDALYESLQEFGLGLYLEDKKSHREFHSPANRFYEMLAAGLPMVFQQESAGMMREAGYDIGGFMAWNADEIPALMERRRDILAEQRHLWLVKASNERAALPETVLGAWGSL